MEIKNTASENKRIFALVYGESGIGKTFLASTLPPENTLIISCESGLLSLSNHKIDYVEVTGESPKSKFENLRKILTSIPAKYSHIYIDSLTEIAQIIVSMYKMQYPDKKDSMNLWGLYNDTIRAMIKYMRDMPQNVYCMALAKTEKDDIGRRFKCPDMPGQVANQVAQYFDLLAYYAMAEIEDKRERILFTSAAQDYLAKDRSGKLSSMESPSLENINKKIMGLDETT